MLQAASFYERNQQQYEQTLNQQPSCPDPEQRDSRRRAQQLDGLLDSQAIHLWQSNAERFHWFKTPNLTVR
jgi:hypothetical protein